MKKELSVHLLYLAPFLIFTSIVRGWIGLVYWPLWVGAIFGSFLADIDHFLYFFLLQPQELTSQRVRMMLQNRQIWATFDLMAVTRNERRSLIFHSALFQPILLVLTFLIVTSSGSLFGIGLVLSFSLHLIVDQFIDMMVLGEINHWFYRLKINLDKEKQLFYWLAVFIIFLLIAMVL